MAKKKPKGHRPKGYGPTKVARRTQKQKDAAKERQRKVLEDAKRRKKARGRKT